MKSRHIFLTRFLLAIALGAGLICSATAPAATYTVSSNNVPISVSATNLDWFTGGANVQATWIGGDPVSANDTVIQFYQNTTTALRNTIAETINYNLNNGGSAFQLSTLTFSGLGSATANANLTNNLTGDALNFSGATGTINLNTLNNGRTFIWNLNNNIQLGTASSASALTVGGNGTGVFNINGSISELQTGGGSSLIKSGNSAVTLGGINSYSGGITINAGTLVLTANNTFTGGITLNGGILQISGTGSNPNAFGNATNILTFAGSATLYNADGAFTMAQGIAVNGVTATLSGAFGETTTVNGAVTGSGALNISAGSNGFVVNLNNTTNTFSGTIWVASSSSGNTSLNMNSLADGTSGTLLKLGNGAATADFTLGSSLNAPVILTNRQVQLSGTTGAVSINNNAASSANSITILPSLSVTGTGSKTLTLGGSNTGNNTFAGAISNFTGSVISITKSGAGKWQISGNMSQTGGLSINSGTLTLSGTNTYSGQTSFNGAGQLLIFAGIQAVSPNTSFLMNQNVSTSDSTVKLLDDTGGVNNSTVSVPNTFTIQNNNSPGNAHTFIVGNNNTVNGGTSSGTTTGSTIAIGTLNWNTYASGTTAYGPIQIQGTDGYRLQINSVTLHNAANLTSGTVGNTFFTPTTANVTLGTVTVGTGNTGQGIQTLVLDGTSSDNWVTGTISDASDVGTSGRPLRVTKSNTSVWTLSGTNTYSGITTISGGTLAVTYLANGGAASSIGSNSNAAANLVLSGGTLSFVGSANNSTDRGFTLSGTSMIEASGSGNATLSWSGSPAAITVNRTLTFGGINAALNTFSGNLANNGANVLSVTKTNSGTWVLTGGNTYTGATAIAGGVLEAVDGVSLPTLSTLQLRGGVFQSTGTFSRAISTAAGAVNWSTSSGGFAARGGVLNLQLDGPGKTNTWNNSSFVLTGNALIFGSTTADNVVDFQNTLKLAAVNNTNLTRTITVNDNPNSTTDLARISGKIITDSLTNNIVKNGNGVLELTGANTYNGVTTVSNGTLLVNNTTGSGTGSGAVNVIGGATLGGTGIVRNVTLGGTLSPGNSIGTLTVSNLTLQSGSFLKFELGTTNASDKVIATGTLNLGALAWGQFSFTTNTGFDAGTYTLIDATGLSGSVDGSTNSLSGFNAYLWADTTPGVNDLMLTVIAIPEPSSLALVGMGIVGAVLLRRYQRKR